MIAPNMNIEVHHHNYEPQVAQNIDNNVQHQAINSNFEPKIMDNSETNDSSDQDEKGLSYRSLS